MTGSIRFSPTVFFLLSFSLFAGLLLAGCAAMGPHFEAPAITVTNLQLKEVKGLESVFLLELRLLNPNDFPLEITGLSCTLKIDDKKFATGLSDSRQEVPPFGTGVIPVTVYASMVDMVGSVIQIINGVDQQSGSIRPLRYDLSGKLRLGGTSGKTLPFQSKGALDLSGRN